MKKLNKLLMPVVGLSTIAATAIPLAACSNYTDGIKVTSEEWTNALKYLVGSVSGASWKSALEDSFSVTIFDDEGNFEEYTDYYGIAFNDDLATMTAVGYTDEGETIEVGELASIAKSNMYFTYIKDDDDWKVDTIDTVSLLQQYLYQVIDDMGGQDVYEWNDETKTYNYCGLYNEDLSYSNSTIKFDSNKKITYINYHTVICEENESGEVHVKNIINTVLHPQYNNVTVDVPDELKTRASDRVKSMTEDSLDVKVSDIIENNNEAGTLILNITPKTAGSTKLTPTPSALSKISGVQVCGIYKNDTLLVKGDDHGYDVDDTTRVITFKDSLKTTDKINVAYKISFNAAPATEDKITFTLAA